MHSSSIVHTHVFTFLHTHRHTELKKKGSLSNAKTPPVGNSKALTHTHSPRITMSFRAHQTFLCSNLPAGRCWQHSSPMWLLLNVLWCPKGIFFHCCHDCIFIGHSTAGWVAANRLECSWNSALPAVISRVRTGHLLRCLSFSDCKIRIWSC